MIQFFLKSDPNYSWCSWRLLSYQKGPSPPGSSSLHAFLESKEASLEPSLLQTKAARRHSCKISLQPVNFSYLFSSLFSYYKTSYFWLFKRSTALVQTEPGWRLPCSRQQKQPGELPSLPGIDPQQGEHGWLLKSSCIFNTGGAATVQQQPAECQERLATCFKGVSSGFNFIFSNNKEIKGNQQPYGRKKKKQQLNAFCHLKEVHLHISYSLSHLFALSSGCSWTREFYADTKARQF